MQQTILLQLHRWPDHFNPTQWNCANINTRGFNPQLAFWLNIAQCNINTHWWWLLEMTSAHRGRCSIKKQLVTSSLSTFTMSDCIVEFIVSSLYTFLSIRNISVQQIQLCLHSFTSCTFSDPKQRMMMMMIIFNAIHEKTNQRIRDLILYEISAPRVSSAFALCRCKAINKSYGTFVGVFFVWELLQLAAMCVQPFIQLHVNANIIQSAATSSLSRSFPTSFFHSLLSLITFSLYPVPEVWVFGIVTMVTVQLLDWIIVCNLIRLPPALSVFLKWLWYELSETALFFSRVLHVVSILCHPP